jgi:hypothetical protein
MPTGIAMFPEKYEKWESTFGDNQDLAAMGRVWYIEAQARYNMKDADGLIETINRVSKAGRDSGYYWRERYNEKGGYGAEKYNEYPANLIRIVQRFLFGIEFDLNGALCIKPVAPVAYWEKGFGQTISWRNANFSYAMNRDGIKGNYAGSSKQTVVLKLQTSAKGKKFRARIDGQTAPVEIAEDCIRFVLPETQKNKSVFFEIKKV